MRIIEWIKQDGPAEPPRENLPPYKLAISAVILIVGLVVAGIVAPTTGLMLAAFALAWGFLLWLLLISAAFAIDARRRYRNGES